MRQDQCRWLLVTGLPATGKSSLCRYLARRSAYAHYDIENHPQGWPAPELQPVFYSDRMQFASELRKRHEQVVIDWGFPPRLVPWIRELQAATFHLVWFSADEAIVRQKFIERGTVPIPPFETQMSAIRQAGLPAGLDGQVIQTLNPNGEYVRPEAVLRRICPTVFDPAR